MQNVAPTQVQLRLNCVPLFPSGTLRLFHFPGE
jgi:hypothetical protein